MIEPIIGYLDPGSGATILQLVLAGTVGIGALAKLRWNRIKGALGQDDEPTEPAESAESAPITSTDTGE